MDLFLLVRQFNIVKGIKGRTRFERSVNRVHWLVSIGFIWRFMSFLGLFLGASGLFNYGMLLTIITSGFVLVFLLFFAVEELPNWNEEAKDTEEGQDDLWKAFLKYFMEAKPYLSKSLQMKDVALQLGVREAELRAVIKLNSSLNFPELINAYRLNHLVSLKLPEHEKSMSSDAMADACGFNSRTTMFRTTKKWLNMSVSQIELGKVSFDLESAIRKK
jgi:AraC-like DNA-binding protein